MSMYVVIAQARVVCTDYHSAPPWKCLCIDDMLRGKLAELMTGNMPSPCLQEPSIRDSANCEGACHLVLKSIEQDIGSTLSPVPGTPGSSPWQTIAGNGHTGTTVVLADGGKDAWGENRPTVELDGQTYLGDIYIDFTGSAANP